MQLKSFEVGVQRLYYVAWLAVAGIGIVTNADELRQQYGHIGDVDLFKFIASSLVVCIAPWVVMRLIRWVYRGFVPAI